MAEQEAARTLPPLERVLAMVRLAFGAVLLVVVTRHPAVHPAAAYAAIALMLFGAVATLALAGRLAWSPFRTQATVYLFAAASCTCLAAAYPQTDPLSWSGFLLLIVAGAARWTLNGALLGFFTFVAVSLIQGRGDAGGAAAGGQASLSALLAVRIGLVGMASVIVGLVTRSFSQFRALQARTAALDDSRAALRRVVDSSPAAVLIVDGEGTVVEFSRRAEAVFATTADAVLGRTLQSTLLPEVRATPAQLSADPEAPPRQTVARRGQGTIPVEITVSQPLHSGAEVHHAVFVTDISRRKRIELLKEGQAAVMRAFAESRGLDDGLARFLQVTCTTLGWQGGQVWTVDEGHDVLRLAAGWYGDALDAAGFEALNRSITFRRGEPLPGRAWSERRPVAVSLDAENSPMRHKAFSRGGLLGGVALPIVTGTGVTGVAEFFATEAPEMDADTRDAFAALGAHLGLFLERRREETAHRHTAARLGSLLQSVADGIITFDEAGVVESANRAACDLLGRTAAQVVGMHIDAMFPRERAGEVSSHLDRGALEWETEGLRRDGTTFPMEFRARAMQFDYSRLFIASLRDTSERRAQTLALQHQALHDSLTGLPNRTLLIDRLERAIAAAARTPHRVALLLMDMDGFKEVNDTLGHHSGDTLLREVAERLRGGLRAEDTVARLGGDEFAILPAGPCDESDARAIADKVLAALQAPFMVEEHAIHARMSIGVAVYPYHGDDAETLMRRADVAMYTAKRNHGGHAVYSPAQDEHAKRRLQLTGELRRAIPGRELVLHYQPRMAIAGGEISSLEALVRWEHPLHGMLPPSEFIPVAEDSDLIHPLTAWVAGEAIRQLRAFSEMGLDLSVAVNLSARNLADQRLPGMIEGLLSTWRVPAGRLRLEMTESVLMASDWQDVLAELHQLGCCVSIDDFGVGYSSLAYLQRLPVDEIKIDKSFVSDMVTNPENAAIVRSTIELGHNLGLKVVAEGVESADCLRMLARFGCDLAQGYHVAPPLTGPEIVAFMLDDAAPGRSAWRVPA